MNSGEYNGLSCAEAQRLMQEAAERGAFGEPKVTFRLKDWGVSRQRYWGTPIPIIHCEKCGLVPAPDEQLPVVLPRRLRLPSRAARRWGACRSS